MNLVDYLLAQADKNAIALIAPEDTYTYGDVCAAAASIGNILRAAGLAKGDRVGILAGNSLFWVASYLGILQMGGVAVPFAKTLEPGRFPQTVAFTGCRALLGQPDYLEKYGHAIASDVLVVSDSPTPLHLSREITQIRFAFESTSCASEPVDEERDLAALMFTSGSTGAPRAVMVSHRNIIANTDSIIAYLRLSAADRMLCVLPFHYCFGTSLLHTHLRVGGSLVLADFWPPTMLFRRLTEMGCTGFAGVPSIFQTLVRNTALSESGFRALRKIQQAGGKLPTPILREMATTLPETEVFVMYGQTEATARLSYLEPDRLSDKLGSIGRAIPGVTLTIVDETGQPMPPGAAGEIAAKGENITRGYWQDPAATAQSFRDGALYTGDIAYADEEGYIFLTGRTKDFIKSRGIRFSSQEVEEKILLLTVVVETAVIGEPHPLLGESVTAFIVLRVGTSHSELEIKQHCRAAGMPHYMIPRRVVFLDSLPKTPHGKVDKAALRGQAASAADN